MADMKNKVDITASIYKFEGLMGTIKKLSEGLTEIIKNFSEDEDKVLGN